LPPAPAAGTAEPERHTDNNAPTSSSLRHEKDNLHFARSFIPLASACLTKRQKEFRFSGSISAFKKKKEAGERRAAANQPGKKTEKKPKNKSSSSFYFSLTAPQSTAQSR
jgi:hypothetical protein